MPMVDLSCPKTEVLAEVDSYIIIHTPPRSFILHIHPDHIDVEGEQIQLENLRKEPPAFVQSTEMAKLFWDGGFPTLRNFTQIQP